MTQLQIFFKNNMESILAIVVLIITLLILFSVAGIDFNPRRHEHIEKIVTVESFINPIELDGNSNNEGGDSGIKKDIDNNDDQEMLMDDEEETGSPANVSASTKQQQMAKKKKQKQDHIFALLKKKDRVFQKTLGDHKGQNSICNPSSTKVKDTENICNTFSEKTCGAHNCCVWLTGQNCAAGNKNGPTYLEKDNKTVDKSQYYYMGKCYGKKCKS